MALILDTSAVIGWVELKDAAIIEALRNHSADEVSRARRGATLRFAREQLAPLPLDPDGDQSEAFGQVASALSREISHNDTWIVAAAVSERRHLLTQDAALAAKAAKAATTPGPFATWLDSHRYSLNIVHVPRRSA